MVAIYRWAKVHIRGQHQGRIYVLFPTHFHAQEDMERMNHGEHALLAMFIMHKLSQTQVL